MRDTLNEFIKCLDEERFADAHVIMEHKWKEYKKDGHELTKLLKGFINGATAFELIKRGNIDGAKRLWEAYEKYLPLMTDEVIEKEPLFKVADEKLQNLKETRLS